MMDTNERAPLRLGLIGFGDVGFGIAAGLAGEGLTGIPVYVRGAFEGPSSALKQERARESGAMLLHSPAEVAQRADVIISAVQGNEAVNAARAIADSLGPRHIFVDMASTTQRVKEEIGTIAGAKGARVAEGAIATSPLTDKHKILVLVSGPGSREFEAAIAPWGMRIEIVSEQMGVASGIKILRSVVIKGLESLLWECMVASGEYGFRDEMIVWLKHWFDRGFDDNFPRLLRTGVIHGRRRAEEAEMCAEALEDVGMKPVMTRATIEALSTIADFGLREKLGGRLPKTVEEALDLVEAGFRNARKGGAGEGAG